MTTTSTPSSPVASNGCNNAAGSSVMPTTHRSSLPPLATLDLGPRLPHTQAHTHHPCNMPPSPPPSSCCLPHSMHGSSSTHTDCRTSPPIRPVRYIPEASKHLLKPEYRCAAPRKLFTRSASPPHLACHSAPTTRHSNGVNSMHANTGSYFSSTAPLPSPPYGNTLCLSAAASEGCRECNPTALATPTSTQFYPPVETPSHPRTHVHMGHSNNYAITGPSRHTAPSSPRTATAPYRPRPRPLRAAQSAQELRRRGLSVLVSASEVVSRLPVPSEEERAQRAQQAPRRKPSLP